MRRTTQRKRRASARADVLATCLVVAIVTAIALPVLARGSGMSKVQQSLSNLTMLGVAHAVYAADDGSIAHAELSFGSAMIMLGSGKDSGSELDKVFRT